VSTWQRTAFVANPGGCPLDQVKALDLFDALCVQVAWGTEPVEIFPEWMAQAHSLGIKLYAWAWCDGKDVEGEANLHRACAEGFDAFSANMEEPYDAHGDSSSPKYKMPGQYLHALNWPGPLALTTTPKFASDMGAFIQSGAIHQPQAFSMENATATFSAAVDHSMSWGWPLSQIRPLIQCYPTLGVRPDPYELNVEAESYDLGGIPYVVESALDGEGKDWLETARPTIEREQPQDHPEDTMEMIGSQHGIKAAYNRMKTIDPAGCNPAFNPDNYDALPLDQLKAWDKVCRTLMILRQDHDEEAAMT